MDACGGLSAALVGGERGAIARAGKAEADVVGRRRCGGAVANRLLPGGGDCLQCVVGAAGHWDAVCRWSCVLEKGDADAASRVGRVFGIVARLSGVG